MENITNEMKNAAAVADNEIEAAVGGANNLGFLWLGNRAKAADGSVCPHCGHAIGILQRADMYLPYVALTCEKCGNDIAAIYGDAQVIML